jgi:flagellar hook assembly protein FlgD
VYNYPNPFSGSTVFMADHNDPQPVTVRIKIYSVAGRLLHKIERTGINERSIKIAWDGRDAEGNRIANGVYIYRLTIVSQSGFGSKTFTGKLAKID